VDICNDAALRVDQQNGLAVRDLYDKPEAGHICRQGVCRRRDQKGRALLQVLNGFFADKI
jgi:hypothetical protein